MNVVAVSDLHLDAGAADALLASATDADLVICAGDFATAREGLALYMERLAPIAAKTVCVPGNNESLDELRAATDATVLHGTAVEWGGLRIAGLGGGVPPLPDPGWPSWDLTEAEARDLLAGLSHVDILVTHSPPHGLGDGHDEAGRIGSHAIRAAVERLAPRLCVFGHVHDCWGASGTHGPTVWRNLGPAPVWFHL